MQKEKLMVVEEEIVDILEEEAGAYDIPLQQTISENQNNMNNEVHPIEQLKLKYKTTADK